MRVASFGIALTLALVFPSACLAGPRQSGAITFTTTMPGAPTGVDTLLDFTNPDAPGQKAPSLESFSLQFPTGSQIDTTVQDQCRATDAELYLEGTAACPASSRIGGGTLVADTGSTDDASFPRYVNNTVVQFNGSNEIIGVSDSDSSPSFRTITHSRLQGTTYTTLVPPFPTLATSDPFTGFKSWRLRDDPFVKDGRTGFRTPRRCPKAGYWTITATFAYWDGVTEVLRSHSACTRPA